MHEYHRPSAETGARPDPAATWVPIGGRRLSMLAIGAAILVTFDVIAIGALIAGQPDSDTARVMLWIIVVLLSLVALVAPLALVAGVRNRRDRVGVDDQGVWWSGREALVVLRWEDLTAVTLGTIRYRHFRGPDTYRHQIELYPRREPDSRDPVLWRSVRHADPPRPQLPPWFWQIELGGVLTWSPEPGENTGPWRLTAAVSAYRPELWAGTIRRDDRSPGTRASRRRPDPPSVT